MVLEIPKIVSIHIQTSNPLSSIIRRLPADQRHIIEPKDNSAISKTDYLDGFVIPLWNTPAAIINIFLIGRYGGECVFNHANAIEEWIVKSDFIGRICCTFVSDEIEFVGGGSRGNINTMRAVYYQKGKTWPTNFDEVDSLPILSEVLDY